MPDVTRMALTPTTSPSRLIKGPPELPKVMAASVWMYSMSLPWRPSSTLPRLTDETTPAVMVLASDSGDPTATTHSPGLTLEDAPRLSVGRFCWGNGVQSCRGKKCHPTSSTGTHARDPDSGQITLHVDGFHVTLEQSAVVEFDLNDTSGLTHHHVGVGDDESVLFDQETRAVRDGLRNSIPVQPEGKKLLISSLIKHFDEHTSWCLWFQCILLQERLSQPHWRWNWICLVGSGGSLVQAAPHCHVLPSRRMVVFKY